VVIDHYDHARIDVCIVHHVDVLDFAVVGTEPERVYRPIRRAPYPAGA